MKTANFTKSIAILSVMTLTVLASCKKAPDGEVTDPNQNYDNNHGMAADTSATTLDTITSNGTQTDPAATK